MTTENRKPKTENRCLTIIGGGLAGSEAAWQAARRGVRVRLYEMKPRKFSPAHQSPLLGELVCSNSLRADSRETAVGLLKEEMRRLDSLIMAAALATRVPAGKALAVDRGEFAAYITRVLDSRAADRNHPGRSCGPGPGGDHHHRHRAADLRAPGRGLGKAHRTGAPPFLRRHRPHRGGGVHRPAKSLPGLPLRGRGRLPQLPVFSEAEYAAFYEALTSAEQVPLKSFEEPRYFEGCLPVEIMAARGYRTLLFGPMKPVGLVDPQTGRQPFAVVQLRAENREGTPLQPGGLSDQAEVRGAGAGLPPDPGPGAGRVRAPGLHPPQHLHPLAGYFVGLPQFSALPPDLFGGADLRGGGLRGIRRHGTAGRDQRRPPGCWRSRWSPRPGKPPWGPSSPTSPTPPPKTSSP